MDNDGDQLKRFIPIFKSLSYVIGMSILAPLALKKLAASASSPISFSYAISGIIPNS